MQNRCVISGQVHSLEPAKITPGGIARQRFWLRHRSRQLEAGQPRPIEFQMPVLLIGETQVRQAATLQAGQEVTVSGFLAPTGGAYQQEPGFALYADSLEISD